MAESTVTLTGLDELRAAVTQLPEQVTARLRLVAQSTAQRVMALARANLAVKTHGTGATANAIHIVEDAANHVFTVLSPGAPHPLISVHTMKRSGRIHTQKVTQNNLPIWLEFGTVKMAARPYMQPASDAAAPQYVAEIEAAAVAVVREAIE